MLRSVMCCGSVIGAGTARSGAAWTRQTAGGSSPASNTSHARSAQVSFRARRGSRRCATARAMPQHQNLDVLRHRIPPGQPQPREHPGHDQIDQLQPHDTASSQLTAIVGTLRLTAVENP